METRHVPLAEAENDQLKDFAATILGLEFDGRTGSQAMRAKIREAGWTKDTIPVLAQSAPRQDTKPSGAKQAFEKNGRPFYRIMIPNEEKPGGEEPVMVSVNGRAMYIPRGEPQEVPAEYVEVLENAQSLVYEQYTGGKGGLGKPRIVQSYPFGYV